MKASKTENRFQTGFQLPKSGLQSKTDINIPRFPTLYHFTLNTMECKPGEHNKPCPHVIVTLLPQLLTEV